MLAGDDHLPAPGSAFAIVRRGYDPEQVDEYLCHLDAQLRMLAADRDSAVEQNGELTRQVNVGWAENDRLKSRLRRLSAPPESVEGMSERLQSMLRLAQDEVVERRKQAEAEAAEIIAKARAEIDKNTRRNEAERMRLEQQRKALSVERDLVLTEARDEAERIRAQARTEDARLRTETAKELERSRQAAEAERRDLDAKSAAKRAQIEEDFNIAMTDRRAGAMAAIEQSQASSRAEARKRLDDAAAQAQQQIDDAEQTAQAVIAAAAQRVNELDAIRERLRSQLAELRDVLHQVVPKLSDPSPERASAVQRNGVQPDFGVDGSHADSTSADGSSIGQAEEATISSAAQRPPPTAAGHSDDSDEPHDRSGSAQEDMSSTTKAGTITEATPMPRPSPEQHPTPRPRRWPPVPTARRR